MVDGGGGGGGKMQSSCKALVIDALQKRDFTQTHVLFWGFLRVCVSFQPISCAAPPRPLNPGDGEIKHLSAPPDQVAHHHGPS